MYLSDLGSNPLIIDNGNASRLFCRVAARAPGGKRSAWLACEIAAAFIRLSEDLKEQLASRGEVAHQGMARLEAQVAANKSRIDELEKLVASLVGIVSVRALENLSHEE